MESSSDRDDSVRESTNHNKAIKLTSPTVFFDDSRVCSVSYSMNTTKCDMHAATAQRTQSRVGSITHFISVLFIRISQQLNTN